ncbi:MAG: GspE/PulE family protein [candidate division Zixibacteria bacterium]
MSIKTFKKRIGELLVEGGAITDEQLKAALQRQKKTGQRIGDVLISQKVLTEDQLMVAIAKRLEIPFVDLDDMLIDREVVELIPAEMARKHLFIPVFRIENSLSVAIYDPLDFIALDEISYYTKLNIKRVVALKSKIEAAIDKFYSIDDAVDKVVEGIKDDEVALTVEDINYDSADIIDGNMPVVKLVNMIIARGVALKASDMHLEPDENGLRVRFRINGLMKDISVLPRSLISGVVSRIKVMSNMDVSEKRVPQDGRFQARIKSGIIDFRVSSLPTSFGEKVAIRILDKSGLILDLYKMGFSEDNLQKWLELISRPEGLILITGPTGSGKTSTLYATLAKTSTSDKSVVTVEDPIEYNLPLVTQVQINEKAGMTFATLLRSIVRQNPDMLMVGEIRDLATAEITIRASMTGHLVYSTLHTSDAPIALDRLIDMGIEPYLVSSAVSGVLAQRLVRTLCDNCKIKRENIDPVHISLLESYKLPAVVFHADGCPKCDFSGYDRRTSIHELLIMSPRMKELVNLKAPHTELRREAIDNGMISLRADGLRKVVEGITTVEEVLRVSHNDDNPLILASEKAEVFNGYQI